MPEGLNQPTKTNLKYAPMTMGLLSARLGGDVMLELLKIQNHLRQPDERRPQTSLQSGDRPIFDPPGPPSLDNFWFLPGRPGGQVGHGGTLPGDDARIISTKAADRGLIILGARGKTAYDDAEDRLGVGTTTPTARLHVVGANDAELFGTPNGDGPYSEGGGFLVSAGATWFENLDESGSDGDTSYAFRTIAAANRGFSVDIGGLENPGVLSNHRIQYTMRRTANTSGSIDVILSLHNTSDDSQVATWQHSLFTSTSYTLNDLGETIAYYEYVLTADEAETIIDYAALYVRIKMEIEVAGSGADEFRFSWLRIQLPGAGAGDGTPSTIAIFQNNSTDSEIITDWQNGAGTSLAQVQSTGHLLLKVGLRLEEPDSGTDTITIVAPTSVTTHTLTLPGANAAGALVNNGTGTLSWSAPAPAAHDLLSASHGDTTASAVTKGDLIVGGVAAWDDLAVGTDGQVLTADSAQTLGVKWATPSGGSNALLDGVNHTDTTNSAVTRGDLIVGNSTPAWDDLAIGAIRRILQSDGTDPSWTDPLTFDSIAYSQSTPLPALPATGDLRLFADNMGDDDTGPRLAQARAHGRATWMQPHVGWVQTRQFLPGVGTVPHVLGTTLGTTAGTISHPAPATTSLFASARRIVDTSASSANANASMFEAGAWSWRGNAAGLGGFYVVWRFAYSISTEDPQFCFTGLHSAVATIGTTTPTNLTNCLGFGSESGDSNALSFIHNDAAGTSTKVDINTAAGGGTNYTMTATKVYQAELYCPPNGSEIFYRISRLDDTTVAPVVGSVTTEIPANTTFLAFHMHANNVNSGVPVAWSLFKMYAEADV